MLILVLGKGKTGSLVAEVARERGHGVRALDINDNPHASALTAPNLAGVDVVIDFTAPSCVLVHMEASVEAGKNMVVGTTGWYREIDRVKKLVESSGTGFLYAANFSVGVNLFLEAIRAAAAALQHDYSAQIFERHHVHKKDSPSGTALVMQRLIREASGKNEDVEITSFREGDVVGMHEVVLDSAADSIYLCHDAKSRRGFAEGAVRAAEWLSGKKGFYDFKDIWRKL